MKTVFFFCLTVVVSFIAVRPLFVNGFYPMHDDTQTSRVYEMSVALADGQFPVRWVPDLGYGSGYPIFNFYAPLPYYVGAIPLFFGVDALTATKVMIGLGIVASGVTMFFLGKALAGNAAGLVSAVLYLYAPYHAVLVYVRGAIGELYGYALLPLVLLGVYYCIKTEYRRGIIIGSIGGAGVLLSHNILGMLLVFFISGGILIGSLVLLFTKSFVRRLPVVRAVVVLLALAIGISAFFTIPAVAEKNYTKIADLSTGSNDFHLHFVYPDQLWDSPWGYAGSAPGRDDGISFKIGKIHLLLGIASLLLLLLQRQRFRHETVQVGYWSLALLSISVIMMLSISGPVWDVLPGFSYIQYPWRFLTITILSLSVASCSLFRIIPWRWQLVVAAVIVPLVIWYNGKYFVPQLHDQRTAQDYIQSSQLVFPISKISDEYLPREYQSPAIREQVVPATIVPQEPVRVAETISSRPREHVFRVVTSRDGWIQTGFSYFLGWQVAVDRNAAAVRQQQGTMAFFLPAGDHQVVMRLRSTAVEALANTISLFALFLLAYVSLVRSVKIPWGKSHRSMS